MKRMKRRTILTLAPVAATAVAVGMAFAASNVFGSPSWPGYLANALNSLENDLGNGDRSTDPTAFAPDGVTPLQSGSATVTVLGTGCPWDCQDDDQDGSVGIADLLALLAAWGDDDDDCNFDGGVVGTSDLLELLANWGPCP